MTAVSAGMRRMIEDSLDRIAKEEGVRLILAVESGSRAWGFHSPDSDYDVRFIYARPETWHYRLGKKRDVIEREITDDLDISGWELSKALSLTIGSNAVIGEWLQSPIRYREDTSAVSALTEFAARALDRKSVTWHYVSLAQRQIDRLYDGKGRLRIKRYFYVLRPVLALRWIRMAGEAMPPMHMTALRAGVALPSEVEAALDMMTREKTMAREKGTRDAGAPPVLDALISSEMEQARVWLGSADKISRPELWDEASDLHLRLSRSER